MDGFFFGPPDPETMERLRAMGEDSDNRIADFFERMTPEDLAIARALFVHAARTEANYAHYTVGRIDMIFRYKYREHCTNCGKVGCGHDTLAETRNIMMQEGALPGFGDDEVVTLQTMTDEAEAEAAIAREAAMKDYRLKDSDRGNGMVVCIECGLEYISLEDRMLRADCHGCQHKAAHG